MIQIRKLRTRTIQYYWLRKSICVLCSTHEICVCVREIIDMFVFFAESRVSKHRHKRRFAVFVSYLCPR
jgi:hypothetical protein